MQVLEFLEGEPCKFALFTSDHRMHFRATAIESKQRWVKALRMAIHKHIEEEDMMRVRSMTETNRKRSNTILMSDKAAVDLRGVKHRPLASAVPRRPSSPFSKSRVNVINNDETTTNASSPPIGFDFVSIILTKSAVIVIIYRLIITLNCC